MHQAVTPKLNTEQQHAVNTPSKTVLVVAGAGSGKTRVLGNRYAYYLKEKEYAPSEVIALTFTNKAAGQMRLRAQDLFPSINPQDLLVGTFHALANKFLRQYHTYVDLPASFQIMDSEDSKRMVNRILKAMQISEEFISDKQVLSYIQKHKENGRSFADIGPYKDRDEATYAEIFGQYETLKKRGALLDFSDLLLLAYKLWQRPDIKAHQKFKAILVDEFQDTNVVQYLWLKEMAGPDTEIFVVGDDDQSIYGWRGACVENIQNFANDFKGTEIIRLEQNYRSTNTILSAANHVISNNLQRLGKNLWTNGEAGSKIGLFGAYNEIEEAQFIAAEISKKLAKGISPKEVAILYRSNAQSRVLEQALRQRNMSYRIYGGLRFFERAEIKDALAYIRLSVNPKDDVAFERVINVPGRGIGAVSLDRIREHAQIHQKSLFESCVEIGQTLPGKARGGCADFCDIVGFLHNQKMHITLSELVEQSIQRSLLAKAYENEPKDKQQARIDNLAELVVAAGQFEAEQDLTADMVSAFLTEVALDSGDSGSEETAINLMTLHAAKGLEFETVYMCGMEDGLFPHRRTTEQANLLEEERRLCYVGITRAKNDLTLTYAHKRSFQNSGNVCLPSRFIDEIPSQFIHSLSIKSVNTKTQSFIGSPYNPSEEMGLRSRVRHPRFGLGVILASEGVGEMSRVQVNFDEFGVKWLVKAYAKLESV